MKRRNFLKVGIVTTGLVGVSGATIWLNSGPGVSSLDWESTILLLDRLTTKKLTGLGLWQPTQVFSHLAQSVEYSMTGYPLHRSQVFKSTIGKSAFAAFSYRGVMSHSLDEPIPGSDELSLAVNSDDSLARLITSLLNFDIFNGELKPHFAYGELSKEEYRLAHIMHINNHLLEIQIE